MQKILAFLLLLTCFTSCIENDVREPCQGNCVVIKGKITSENNSAIPVANVAYELNYYGNPTGIGGGKLLRKIAQGQTDANGNYEIRFYPKDEELNTGHYSFNYWKTGYVNEQSNVEKSFNNFRYYAIPRRDTVITTNLHLPAESKITVHLKNFIPPTAADGSGFLQCTYSFFGNPNHAGQSSSVVQVVSSNGSEQTLILTAAGNQPNVISFSGYKNGVAFEKSDTIYPILGQEFHHEITY